MIIRTNLCWPLAKREPRKRKLHFALALVALVALALGGYWLLLEHERRTLASAVQARRELMDTGASELAALRARHEENVIRAARRDQLVQFANQRLNWAPILERLFAAVPSNAEISSLSADTAGQEECRISISGTAAGAQPRLECDKLRVLFVQALHGVAEEVRADFDRLEESPRLIQWNGEQHAAADFAITVTWRHRVNADE